MVFHGELVECAEVLGSHCKLRRVGILLQGSGPSLLTLLLGLVPYFTEVRGSGNAQKFIEKSIIGGMRYFEKGMHGAFLREKLQGRKEKKR